MKIKEDLEKVLLSEIAVNVEKKTIDPDENLVDQGIIDSLGIMKLINFMESSYGIHVSNEEIVPENLQTLNLLVHFVEKKMQEK